MIYEIDVTINNSPTRVRKWGYIFEAESAADAIDQALNNARVKADRPHSRYRKCTFTVEPGDCRERPDW